jgi:hypothetical protein
MEEAASEKGFWLESGEGDPCDLFLCRAVPEESETEESETEESE